MKACAISGSLVTVNASSTTKSILRKNKLFARDVMTLKLVYPGYVWVAYFKS